MTQCGNPNCPWVATPENHEGTFYAMNTPWCFRCARLGETLLYIMRHAFASAWSRDATKPL